MSKLSKGNWATFKHHIKKSNNTFYELLERVSPSNRLHLYLAEYSWGELLGSRQKVYLPNDHGQLYVLGSRETSEEIMNDLGYGKSSFPLGMIIENHCEWFYENDTTKENFPFAIPGEGTIFNQQIIFGEEQGVENNRLSASSGARSLFMLPYIGSQSNHERLKSTFQLSLPAPKNASEHFDLFREILGGYSIRHTWVSRVIYFAEEWINQIKNNSDWMAVKYFFSEKLRKRFSTNLYNIYNDLFQTTESINRYRPSPFLIDTAKYIFSIAMGQGPGFKPATDNTLSPVNVIQEAYMDYYQLPYTPTIMVPGILGEEKNSIYYSLQQPNTNINTFKIGMNNSTYRELVALRGILLSYKTSFLSETSSCFGSDLYYACKNIQLTFYHNKPSSDSDGILNSKTLVDVDSHFNFSPGKKRLFSADAKFLRGCIKISRSGPE